MGTDVLCVLRCPSFGGRVSITKKCGIEDIIGKRKNGTYGVFSGSIKLNNLFVAGEKCGLYVGHTETFPTKMRYI